MDDARIRRLCFRIASGRRLGEVLAGAQEDGIEIAFVVSARALRIYTGCRLSEILTLHWDYVASHHLELPDSKTRRRRIPMPSEAFNTLTNLP